MLRRKAPLTIKHLEESDFLKNGLSLKKGLQGLEWRNHAETPLRISAQLSKLRQDLLLVPVKSCPRVIVLDEKKETLRDLNTHIIHTGYAFPPLQFLPRNAVWPFVLPLLSIWLPPPILTKCRHTARVKFHLFL